LSRGAAQPGGTRTQHKYCTHTHTRASVVCTLYLGVYVWIFGGLHSLVDRSKRQRGHSRGAARRFGCCRATTGRVQLCKRRTSTQKCRARESILLPGHIVERAVCNINNIIIYVCRAREVEGPRRGTKTVRGDKLGCGLARFMCVCKCIGISSAWVRAERAFPFASLSFLRLSPP